MNHTGVGGYVQYKSLEGEGGTNILFKGGGCNFGVIQVSSPVQTASSGQDCLHRPHRFFAPPALEKLVAAADDWMAKGPNEKDSMV